MADLLVDETQKENDGVGTLGKNKKRSTSLSDFPSWEALALLIPFCQGLGQSQCGLLVTTGRSLISSLPLLGTLQSSSEDSRTPCGGSAEGLGAGGSVCSGEVINGGKIKYLWAPRTFHKTSLRLWSWLLADKGGE